MRNCRACVPRICISRVAASKAVFFGTCVPKTSLSLAPSIDPRRGSGVSPKANLAGVYINMSMRSRTLVALVAGAIFGFSGAIAGDVKAERRADEPDAQAQLPWEQARLFAEVYERIKREYVDEVDDKQLMEKAIRGMVAALDPHSAFLDNDEFEEIRLSTMGSYPGVGIEVVAEDSAVKVLRPIEGSPADQAGMMAGD